MTALSCPDNLCTRLCDASKIRMSLSLHPVTYPHADDDDGSWFPKSAVM